MNIAKNTTVRFYSTFYFIACVVAGLTAFFCGLNNIPFNDAVVISIMFTAACILNVNLIWSVFMHTPCWQETGEYLEWGPNKVEKFNKEKGTDFSSYKEIYDFEMKRRLKEAQQIRSRSSYEKIT